MIDTVIEEKLININIGDLVEIDHVSPATSYFGWTGPHYGIYLGMFEFTHYVNKDEKTTDRCYKVWVSGEIKYVSTSDTLTVLAAASQTSE